MTGWKGYLESRTIWSNLIGLLALILDLFGLQSLGAEQQAQLIDTLLKLIELGGFVGGLVFRAIARKRISAQALSA